MGVLDGLQGVVRSLPWLKGRTVRDEGVSRVLPSHLRETEMLAYTIRLQRRVGAVFAVGFVGLIGWQQFQLHQVNTALRNQDYIVVPGAADFVRVRPNMIGDRTIMAFARYFAERMVSVGYLDLEDRYRSMRQHMAPALWAELQVDLEETMGLFRAVRAAEVLQIMGVEAERTDLPGGGAGFRAVLQGQVSRYAGERRLEHRTEIIEIWFRTSALSGEDPWLFEVTDFVRSTPEEFRRLEHSRRSSP